MNDLSDNDRLGIEWRVRLAESGLDVEVHPMREDERAFVFETTCKVRWPRRGQDQFTWAQWRDIYGKKVNDAIDYGKVLVACSGDVILGYVIHQRDVLEMVYVKAGIDNGLRGNGIGLMLLEFAGLKPPVTVSAPTVGFERWAQHHDMEWRREDR